LLRKSKFRGFYTHDQKRRWSWATGIAVLNAGQLEQVGTPDEVYNRPETESWQLFWARLTVLGVVGHNTIEIGAVAVVIPAQETARFRRGQSVKLIFRPEDVCLGRTGAIPEGLRAIS